MRKMLKRLNSARTLAIMIAAILSVGMWGCSDQVEFKWSDSRGTPSIAGFIDDSLVVAYDCRGWLETTETWNGGYSDDESCGHDRLLVYNYRVQEDGPRWTDSLTNKRGGYHWYQLTDSVFWRWEGKNILLWKIGETAHEMKLSRKNEGCSQEFEINRIHQWLDDGFIALGGNLFAEEDSCQYAVLDTISGTLTYKRLDKNLEWIKVCDDVRAWDEDVFCLALENEPLDLLLVKNDNILDSLLQGKPYSWSKYTKVGFAGNILNLGNNVCKIVSDNFQCIGVSIRDALEYRCKDGTTIIY